MKQESTTTRSRAFASSNWRKSLVLVSVCTSQYAFAQSMPGQALFNYVTPIILFLTVGAVLISLGASIVAQTQLAKNALYSVVICVVMFFVIKTASSLAAAVQN